MRTDNGWWNQEVMLLLECYLGRALQRGKLAFLDLIWKSALPWAGWMTFKSFWPKFSMIVTQLPSKTLCIPGTCQASKAVTCFGFCLGPQDTKVNVQFHVLTAGHLTAGGHGAAGCFSSVRTALGGLELSCSTCTPGRLRVLHPWDWNRYQPLKKWMSKIGEFWKLIL